MAFNSSELFDQKIESWLVTLSNMSFVLDLGTPVDKDEQIMFNNLRSLGLFFSFTIILCLFMTGSELRLISFGSRLRFPLFLCHVNPKHSIIIYTWRVSWTTKVCFYIFVGLITIEIDSVYFNSSSKKKVIDNGIISDTYLGSLFCDNPNNIFAIAPIVD